MGNGQHSRQLIRLKQGNVLHLLQEHFALYSLFFAKFFPRLCDGYWWRLCWFIPAVVFSTFLKSLQGLCLFSRSRHLQLVTLPPPATDLQVKLELLLVRLLSECRWLSSLYFFRRRLSDCMFPLTYMYQLP